MKIDPKKQMSKETIRQLNECKADKIIQTYTTANKSTQTNATLNKETQTNHTCKKGKKWANCFVTSIDSNVSGLRMTQSLLGLPSEF